MKQALPLLLLVLAACKPNGPAHPGTGAAGGGKRAFPVEVRTVATEDVKYTIDAVGTLEPEEQVKVTARVQGMVEKSNVQPVLEMGRMIEVTRAYTSLANLMTRTDELRRTAINKLADASSS